MLKNALLSLALTNHTNKASWKNNIKKNKFATVFFLMNTQNTLVAISINKKKCLSVN